MRTLLAAFGCALLFYAAIVTAIAVFEAGVGFAIIEAVRGPQPEPPGDF